MNIFWTGIEPKAHEFRELVLPNIQKRRTVSRVARRMVWFLKAPLVQLF
jgi:hypothetical protein